MKIYAIRHGQTDLSSEKQLQGSRSDQPLNEEGRKQARETAELLADKNIELIITSPLKCAVETADIIADCLNIKQNKIIKGTRLYERDFGDYEGKLISELGTYKFKKWTYYDEYDEAAPNGETTRQFATRVFDFLNEEISNFKELAERGRINSLYEKYKEITNRNKSYNEDESRKLIEQAISLTDEMKQGFPETALLFVVHGHVLRAMYWYFNGLPEEDNEKIINTENCMIYEFDNLEAKTPWKIETAVAEEKLKAGKDLTQWELDLVLGCLGPSGVSSSCDYDEELEETWESG